MQQPRGDYATQRVVAVRVYQDVESAQRYLAKAFSFSPGILERNAKGDAVHAEVFMGGTVVWLHRVDQEHGLSSARALPTQPGGLVVFVPDVDAHYKHAKEVGAEIASPLQNQPYGQKEYAARDPEGNYWYFATRTE